MSFMGNRTSTPVAVCPPPVAPGPSGCRRQVEVTQPIVETVMRQPPRIPMFSGSASKGEVTYEAWRFEIKCLLKNGCYSQDMLLQSIRRSLKDEPNRLVMHLGEEATVSDVLKKLDGVYGMVESGTTLLQQFYNTKQENEETVAAFGCRLEDILNKAVLRGAVRQEQADQMLRSKLWTGLRDERVRNASRYKYESIGDFDTLRAELRAMEQEVNEMESVRKRENRPMNTTIFQQTSDHVDSVAKSLSEVMSKVKELEEKVSKQDHSGTMLKEILSKIQRLEEKQLNLKGPSERGEQRAQQRR